MRTHKVVEHLRTNVNLTVKEPSPGSAKIAGAVVAVEVLEDGSVVWREGPPEWCRESPEQVISLALDAHVRYFQAKMKDAALDYDGAVTTAGVIRELIHSGDDE